MKNNFTKQDIKNSVEYKSKYRNFKIILICFVLLVLLACCSVDSSMEDEKFEISTSLICFLVVIIILYVVCFIITSNRANYILKNYHKFNAYEVNLQYPRNSLNPKRNEHFYRIVLDIEGEKKVVDTDGISFKKSMDLEHKKVIGLYDEEKERFYIIKVIGDVDIDDRVYPEDIDDFC